MTLPAQATLPGQVILTDDSGNGYTFDKTDVAADTIILDCRYARLFDMDDLRFKPQGEDGRVSEAILSLEDVLRKKIVVGNVTIIADGDPGMATVLPRGELGSHDMTVHACFGTVGQIGDRVGNPKDETPNAYENAE